MPTTSSFDRRDKLLIVHADDVGMCHSVNKATFLGFQQGVVSSCSLMMPCPWIIEAARFFANNPTYDHGIHSTLTSEWELYRWGPVSSKSEVPSLLDGQLCLWRNAEDAAKASKNEVEAELRAQVDKAFRLSLRPSHLDTHMGTVYFRLDLLEVYIRVALENGLKPMLVKPTKESIEQARDMGMPISEDIVSKIFDLGLPMLDNLITSTYGSDLQERIKWLRATLMEIEPGTVSQIIVHLGMPDEEIKAIMPSYADRYLDYQLVTSRDAKKIIEELGFTLVSWRDLG